MKTISKTLVGTVAAGAMALSASAPAQAQYRGHDRHNDGISAGDIIAGAVIIGGIAAIASAAGRDNRGYGDRYGSNGNYGYRGDPRSAVDQCVRTAESQAGRYGRADVTRITQVRDRDNGWEVRGEITVNGGGNGGYGDRWSSNGRGGYNDRYGNGNYGRSGYGDSGSFKCRIDRGRVYDVDFSGLRGL